MHHEDALLSRAVHTNDLNALIRENIGPEYFYKHTRAANKLFNYHSEYSCLPTLGIVQEQAAKSDVQLDLTPVDERDIPHYLMILRTTHVYNQVSGPMNKALSEAQRRDMDSFFRLLDEVRHCERYLNPTKMLRYRATDARINEVARRAEALRDGQGILPLFIPTMGSYLTGYMPGRFYIPAGRPKKGKSHYLYMEAANLITHGYNGMFFTLEMSGWDVNLVMDSIKYHYSISALQSGIPIKFDPDGHEIERGHEVYRRDLESQPVDWGDLRVLGRGGRTGDITTDVMRAYIEDFEPDFVMVDYVGIVDVREKMDRTSKAAYVAAELKKMSQDYEIPVISPHQLNRDAEHGSVGLHNLADSDDVARHADVVIWVDSEPAHGLDPNATLQQQGENIFKMQVIGNRFGPKGAKFAADWNFDTGYIEPARLSVSEELDELSLDG